MEKMITPLIIDISTGDIITPHEIKFKYNMLLDDCCIDLWSYNIETILAKKLQTILSRGVLNTRRRDYYNVYMLLSIYANKVDKTILMQAFSATYIKRGATISQEYAA